LPTIVDDVDLAATTAQFLSEQRTRQALTDD
ncbi:MAG: hypothetical protein RLY12_366, partial [Verrucomicrobiota bacterium]